MGCGCKGNQTVVVPPTPNTNVAPKPAGITTVTKK